jgi:membrane-bound lytic murein transglycosylase D
VAVDSPTDLRVIAKCLDVSLSDLQELNPCLIHLQTPPKAESFTVNVPAGRADGFAEIFARIPKEDRLVFHRHKVRRGETLGHIARKYGTTVSAIQGANGMGRRTTIYVNQTLKIPAGKSYALPADFDRAESVRHTVRRGESLGRIARDYGVAVQAILAVNRIDDPARIYPGNVLVIPPSRTARNSSAAKAEIESAGEQGSVGPSAANPADAEQQAARGGEDAMPVLNTADSLGRGPSTLHLVEDAREAIKNLPEEEPPPATTVVHKVRRGDTLSEIAARYKVRLSDLRRWNGLGRSSRIYPGQRLTLRNPGSTGGSGGSKWHVVQRGDSLWKIAKRYGLRVADLMRLNSLRRGATIYPGQKLVVS